MSNKREVVEGTQYQGVDETIVYTIDTTNWAASPTSPSMVVKNNATGLDVSATVAPTGSVTAAGNVITLKAITGLTAGVRYRVEVKFVVGANTYECYFFIEAET